MPLYLVRFIGWARAYCLWLWRNVSAKWAETRASARTKSNLLNLYIYLSIPLWSFLLVLSFRNDDSNLFLLLAILYPQSTSIVSRKVRIPSVDSHAPLRRLSKNANTQTISKNVLSITAAQPFPSSRFLFSLGKYRDIASRLAVHRIIGVDGEYFTKIIFIRTSARKNNKSARRNYRSDSILRRSAFVAELIYLLFKEMWLLFSFATFFLSRCLAWFSLHPMETTCTTTPT